MTSRSLPSRRRFGIKFLSFAAYPRDSGARPSRRRPVPESISALAARAAISISDPLMPDRLYVPAASGVTPRPAERLLDRLVHALLPAPCLGCGRPLPAVGSPLGLCEPCRAALAPLARESCAVCLRPFAASVLPADYRCGA